MKGKTENRRPNDYYPTPEPLTEALLRRWGVSKDSVIAEPCAGDGAITRVLRRHGYDVVTGDIDPRWDWVDFPQQDFLHPSALEVYAGVDVIVSNFPFGIADDVVAQALRITPHVVTVLPINWLEPCRSRQAIAGLPGRAIVFQRCKHTDFSGGGGDMKAPMWRIWDPDADELVVDNVLEAELVELAGQQSLL